MDLKPGTKAFDCMQKQKDNENGIESNGMEWVLFFFLFLNGHGLAWNAAGGRQQWASVARFPSVCLCSWTNLHARLAHNEMPDNLTR